MSEYIKLEDAIRIIKKLCPRIESDAIPSDGYTDDLDVYHKLNDLGKLKSNDYAEALLDVIYELECASEIVCFGDKSPRDRALNKEIAYREKKARDAKESAEYWSERGRPDAVKECLDYFEIETQRAEWLKELKSYRATFDLVEWSDNEGIERSIDYQRGYAQGRFDEACSKGERA